jgi:hypothetical protein
MKFFSLDSEFFTPRRESPRRHLGWIVRALEITIEQQLITRRVPSTDRHGDSKEAFSASPASNHRLA